MHPSPRVLPIAAALALLAGCAVTPVELELEQRARVADGGIDKRTLASDDMIATLVDPAGPGCSAAVGIRGEVVWAGAAGLADLEASTPVTTSTRFDIASVSKQFTATAILLLEREGALSLSDPVSAYVDGLPAWGAEVTLDQLLHHTSHIPDYWVELEREGIGFTDAADQETTLRAIARERRLTPGDGYEYSNSNYVLLAEVVGRVSGLPLPRFLAERVFAPLGLAMKLDPTAHAADIALSYDDDLARQEGGWTAYGHTGIITTPSELVRWGDQYRTGDLVQDDLAAGAVPDGTGDSYAAGVYITPDGRLTHSGRWGGYLSRFTVSADRSTVIAVMCNGHLSPRFPVADALRDIWDPAPAPPEAPHESEGNG